MQYRDGSVSLVKRNHSSTALKSHIVLLRLIGYSKRNVIQENPSFIVTLVTIIHRQLMLQIYGIEGKLADKSPGQ